MKIYSKILLCSACLVLLSSTVGAQSFLGEWDVLYKGKPDDQIEFLRNGRVEYHSPEGVRRTGFFREMINQGFSVWYSFKEYPYSEVDIEIKDHDRHFYTMRGLYRFYPPDRLVLYFTPGKGGDRPRFIPPRDTVNVWVELKRRKIKPGKILK